MKFQDNELNESFDRILDTFSGADGCISFINLKIALMKIEKDNSAAAASIMEVVHRFARLIQSVG